MHEKRQEKEKTILPIAQQKEVLRLKPGHLKLSGDGVFYTIQGEGRSMGLPACFLRLHLCNLTCVWCDTRYTWDKTTEEFWTESQDIPTERVAHMIQSAWGCVDERIKKRLVITGGEPLLQQKELRRVLELLPDWIIEIETNGTIVPLPELGEQCLFNCSPKLSNALVPEQKRIRGHVLKILNEKNTTFKFVVKQPSDLEEIEREFVQGFDLDPSKILVMPEGTSSSVLNGTIEGIIEIAKTKGYRILTRLHCEIWGDQRGV